MQRTLCISALLFTAGLLYLWLVEIPRQVRFPAQTPITSSPADVGLLFESFQLSPADHDLKLDGWWMPADNAHATLLFLHGGSSNRDSRYFLGLEFYRAMVGAGISVAAIDLRNHGASGSDDRGIQFGFTEWRDAEALVQWAQLQTPNLPVFLMGISMGGATAIHAIANGTEVNGLILLDPLLLTGDALVQAVRAETGLPSALITPAGWAASAFHGFPAAGQQAFDLAATLTLPVLALQDPQDPVTRATPLTTLAKENSNITLWLAPDISRDDPRLARKGRWGSHVATFELFPDETVQHIDAFIRKYASSFTPPASSAAISSAQ